MIEIIVNLIFSGLLALAFVLDAYSAIRARKRRLETYKYSSGQNKNQCRKLKKTTAYRFF